MLAAALEAEVDAYIAELAQEKDERGRRLVVRNGHHQSRKVATAAGTIKVRAPRGNDKRVDEETGERKRFSSAILPPWARKSPKISEVLPLLYLHGLSSGDFVPALEQFLGSSAGLSPATVTRLTAQWQADHQAFGERDLSDSDYVMTGTVQATISSSGHGPLAEIAWVMGTPWQGRGIATEAARGLVDWLSQQPVQTVIAHIHPEHQASAAVATAAELTPTNEWAEGEIRWRRSIGR